MLKRNSLYSIETEEALIGTLLQRQELIPIAFEIISPTDCYQAKSQAVLQVILELSLEGISVDLLTVANRLTSSKAGIEISWLSDLTTNVIPLSSQVKQHARMIKRYSMSRAVLRLLQQGLECVNNGDDPENVASQHMIELSKILSTTQGNAAHLSEIIPGVIQKIKDNCNGIGSAVGITSSFYQLDRITGGFRPAELIILAARPSMGKTALALNIAKHASLSGFSVLFFSLEMDKNSLVQRLIADIANVSFSAMRNGELSSDDLSFISKSTDIIEALPFIIDDRASLNISQIEARTAQVAAKQKVGMVVVDYLQLCKAKAESRFVEVSEISHFLKSLAKKYNAPVLALSQLSRDIEKRQDQRPKLSDLRESGDIEQDADLIMFIAGKKEATVRKLIIAKHRNGPLGEMDLNFVGWCQRFEDISSVK